MDLKDSWAQFWEGVPIEQFCAHVNQLDEAQLRYLHKQMLRKRIGGGTSAVVGTLALLPSCGVSVVGIMIGGRRVMVNTDRIGIIEARLKQKQWDGHDLEGKDFVLPVSAAIVGLGVGFGLDAVFHAMSGGADALASSGGGSATVSDVSGGSVAGQDTGASGFVPAPVSPPPFVPPATDGSWIQTDAGMAATDMPIDGTYGQDIFQEPVYPMDPGVYPADPAGATDFAIPVAPDAVPVSEDTIPVPPVEDNTMASSGYAPTGATHGWGDTLVGGAAIAIAHLGANTLQHGLPHTMQSLTQQAKEALIEKGGEKGAKAVYEKTWKMVEEKKLPRRLSKWLK